MGAVLAIIGLAILIGGCVWMMFQESRCPACGAGARFQRQAGPHGLVGCTSCGHRYVAGECDVD